MTRVFRTVSNHRSRDIQQIMLHIFANVWVVEEVFCIYGSRFVLLLEVHEDRNIVHLI